MSQTDEVIDRFFAALGSHDSDAVVAQFPEKFHWHVPGPPYRWWSNVRTTKPEVADYCRQLWIDLTDSEAEITGRLTMGSESAIFGIFAHTVKDTGKRFSQKFAMHFKVEQGLVAYIQVYEDTYVVDQAFTAD